MRQFCRGRPIGNLWFRVSRWLTAWLTDWLHQSCNSKSSNASFNRSCLMLIYVIRFCELRTSTCVSFSWLCWSRKQCHKWKLWRAGPPGGRVKMWARKYKASDKKSKVQKWGWATLALAFGQVWRNGILVFLPRIHARGSLGKLASSVHAQKAIWIGPVLDSVSRSMHAWCTHVRDADMQCSIGLK